MPGDPIDQPNPLLGQSERYWRDHQPWLKEQGYELRPRFHPGWVPSWVKDPSKKGFKEEDGEGTRSAGIDATRVSDGKVVHLKRAYGPEAANEVAIMKLLASSPDRIADPKNHCVPLLDVLQPVDDPEYSVLVIPYLGFYDAPLFSTLGEIVDMFRQLVEGVQFMHHLHVAHCDIKWNNLMADSLHLFQSRPHPSPLHFERTMDMKSRSKHLTRTQSPVTYYFIDFGLSHSFTDDQEPLMPSGIGGNEIPEFESKQPVNAYAVDVYSLGSFMTYFTKGADLTPRTLGLEFLDGLLEEMCRNDPKQRPTIDEVASKLDEITKSLPPKVLRARVVTKHESPVTAFFRDMSHFWRTRVHPNTYRYARSP